MALLLRPPEGSAYHLTIFISASMKLPKYFSMLRSDRQGILFLLILALATAALFLHNPMGGGDDLVARGDSLGAEWGRRDSAYRHDMARRGMAGRAYQDNLSIAGDEVTALHERFAFDPNTADSTALLRLGLSRWQVRAIYRYRNKGGVFRQPSDFARLYGLTQRQYRELVPYIRISDDYRPAAELFAGRAVRIEEKAVERDTMTYPRKLSPGERICLSQADTSLLKRVPGIGSYFARRIVAYRSQLGGFVSVEQLAEIEDFPLSAMAYFTLGEPRFQPLAVNSLTLSQLRRHPYLNFYQARAIVDYRRLHGRLHGMAELRMMPDFTPDDLKRLEPYLNFN